jgi:lipopolysaccharide/colanic/teichoic acid biosynthesis glycosyltransferase
VTTATPIQGAYERFGKRLLDVCASATAVLLLFPLFAIVAAAVWLTMGRPILHADWRAGLSGAPFLLRKFRTMSNQRDATGWLLPDAERLTPLGRWLRALSLDELPQLIHVLTGEMSLVGPRPLPYRYVERYTRDQARRLIVKPGITGLAQVRGRNATTWDHRFEQDLWYVDHRSLLLDLKLLLATVVVVIRREGVSHPGHATMHEFRGTGQ